MHRDETLIRKRLLILFVVFSLLFGGIFGETGAVAKSKSTLSWSGKASVTINKNKPKFSKKQKTGTKQYTSYKKLDKYGRAKKAVGCLGPKTINDGERMSIGHIKPSGWEQEKYKGSIDSKPPYLYNRGHLLMQAAAAGINSDNCNSEKNLITMTRYCNVDGMLPYETKILNYINSTKNHVFYRVTPVYKGSELVARGVHMEAYSIEDEGKGVCFNVYCFNVQPGIKITYKTGASSKKKNYKKEMVEAVKNGATTVDIEAVDSVDDDSAKDKSTKKQNYVLNKNTKRFHYPSCPSVKTIKDKNKAGGKYKRSDLINQGYKPCGNCNP